MPAKLNALLASGDRTIVGPETARQLAEYAESPEPPLATREQVEEMAGLLALHTAQPKATQAEEAVRLKLHWLALRDIPADDLREAFLKLLQRKIFMPKSAEIREAALAIGAPRRYRKSRARHLVWLHEREWTPPTEYVTPEELASIKVGLNAERAAA